MSSRRFSIAAALPRSDSWGRWEITRWLTGTAAEVTPAPVTRTLPVRDVPPATSKQSTGTPYGGPLQGPVASLRAVGAAGSLS